MNKWYCSESLCWRLLGLILFVGITADVRAVDWFRPLIMPKSDVGSPLNLSRTNVLKYEYCPLDWDFDYSRFTPGGVPSTLKKRLGFDLDDFLATVNHGQTKVLAQLKAQGTSRKSMAMMEPLGVESRSSNYGAGVCVLRNHEYLRWNLVSPDILSVLTESNRVFLYEIIKTNWNTLPITPEKRNPDGLLTNKVLFAKYEARGNWQTNDNGPLAELVAFAGHPSTPADRQTMLAVSSISSCPRPMGIIVDKATNVWFWQRVDCGSLLVESPDGTTVIFNP